MEDLVNSIIRLRDAHANSTQGKWRKGLTTHDTVMGDDAYKIGSFHHADDAQFCDVAHELVPVLIAELERVSIALIEEKLRATMRVQEWEEYVAGIKASSAFVFNQSCSHTTDAIEYICESLKATPFTGKKDV